MLSIGLIGCGRVAHANYAATMRRRSEYKIDLVCDLDPAQAASAAAIFGARVVDSDVIVEESDAVIIATPPSTHAELIRRSLRRGRTILCEKPLTTSSEEAADLADEARAAGALLRVGHFRRTFPQVELARQLASTGILGDITTIVASEGGRFTWQAVSGYTTRDPAGGVLWDTGSHTIDMALFASCVDHWDEFAVTDIAVSRDRPEPSHEFTGQMEVVGEQGFGISLRVSRRRALPNIVKIIGSRGALSFVVGLDRHVRLGTKEGSVVFTSDRRHEDLLECLDLQLKRIFLGLDAEVFSAERFVGQVRILEGFSKCPAAVLEP